MRTLLILLLFVSTTATAQLSDQFKKWITAEDPETLEYWYTHDFDCPWSKAEAEEVIAGVIKRSRIKTSHGTGGVNRFYLNTVVQCLESMSVGGDLRGYSVNFEIYYGNFPVLYEKPYGGLLSMGKEDKNFALESLKSYIEAAVTDFVEVNFLMDDQ
jgi:hypothetical protein